MFKVNNKGTKISKYIFFRDLEATEFQNDSTLLHMLSLYLPDKNHIDWQL